MSDNGSGSGSDRVFFRLLSILVILAIGLFLVALALSAANGGL